MRSRGQNIILFYTHHEKMTNKYFFEINNNQYLFIKDSIEYMPDVLQLRHQREHELYKTELISRVKMLVDKMDEFNIRDVKGDLADVGIGLKIYLQGSDEVMLYVPNLNNITSTYWKGYITSMNKLDNKWYYTKDK